MSLLHSSFMLFQSFLNQMIDGVFTSTKIGLRYKDGCRGLTFFDKSYLLRVIHLVLALYEEMVNGGYKLRLACFGSHINENIIGRIRVSCHGNPSFTVLKRVLAKAEVRRVMQAELGIEHNVKGRDNLGGTKLNSRYEADLNGLDFATLTEGLIQTLEAQRPDHSSAAFEQLCSFLTILVDRKEVVPIYAANSAANSGILARLIKFSPKQDGDRSIPS